MLASTPPPSNEEATMPTSKDILFEFSKIEENWDFIINGLISIDLPDVEVFDVEIKLLDATTNIREVNEKIKKVRGKLELIDDIELEQKDIDNLDDCVGKIAYQSELMQKETVKFKGAPNYPNIDNIAGGIIHYRNQYNGVVKLIIREYINPISNYLDKILIMFAENIHSVESSSNFPSPKGKSDSKKIDELESRITAIKQQSEDKLKEIEKIKNDTVKFANETKEKSEEVLSEAREARGKIITTDIMIELSKKSETSQKELKLATRIHMGVLAVFFAYIAILVFNSFGWEFLKLQENFWENVGLRSLLLSPYFLVIVFSSQYYDRVFRRNEYFASKHIIASLVEGFKDQAKGEEYRDAIGSTIFSELLLDPADYLDRTEKRKKEKESVITSLIDKIKGKATEDIDIKVELEKLVSEIEKLKATKDAPPPTG